MNKRLAFLLLTGLTVSGISGCKIAPPSLQRIDNVKTEKSVPGNLALSADVVMHNPNRIRLRITDIALDATLDNKSLGTIGKKGDVLITGKSDFTVPVGANLALNNVLHDHSTSLLGLLTNKEMILGLKGVIMVKWLFFRKAVPLQWQQKVKPADFIKKL